MKVSIGTEDDHEAIIEPNIDAVLSMNIHSESMKKMQLQKILSKRDNFDVFMLYLSKDSSMTFLTAFIEIMQNAKIYFDMAVRFEK